MGNTVLAPQIRDYTASKNPPRVFFIDTQYNLLLIDLVALFRNRIRYAVQDDLKNAPYPGRASYPPFIKATLFAQIARECVVTLKEQEGNRRRVIFYYTDAGISVKNLSLENQVSDDQVAYALEKIAKLFPLRFFKGQRPFIAFRSMDSKSGEYQSSILPIYMTSRLTFERVNYDKIVKYCNARNIVLEKFFDRVAYMSTVLADTAA